MEVVERGEKEKEGREEKRDSKVDPRKESIWR